MRQTAWILAAFVALLLWQSMPTTNTSADLSAATIDILQVHTMHSKNIPDLVVIDPI